MIRQQTVDAALDDLLEECGALNTRRAYDAVDQLIGAIQAQRQALEGQAA